MIRDGGFVGAIVALFECRLETTDTFSDSFTEFGKFLRSEHEQSNSEDYQQMCGLQESFEHEFLLLLKVTKHRSLTSADAAPLLGEQTAIAGVGQPRAIAAESPAFLPEWFGSHSDQASNAKKPLREEAAGSND